MTDTACLLALLLIASIAASASVIAALSARSAAHKVDGLAIVILTRMPEVYARALEPPPERALRMLASPLPVTPSPTDPLPVAPSPAEPPAPHPLPVEQPEAPAETGPSRSGARERSDERRPAGRFERYVVPPEPPSSDALPSSAVVGTPLARVSLVGAASLSSSVARPRAPRHRDDAEDTQLSTGSTRRDPRVEP